MPYQQGHLATLKFEGFMCKNQGIIMKHTVAGDAKLILGFFDVHLN